MNRHRLEWLWMAVGLGGFLYVWKGVQSQLLYYGFGVFAAYPVFAWQADFLRTAFSVPAGPVDALSAVLAQLYRDPLMGALVIALVLGALFAGVRRLLAAIQAERFRDLAWAPVIVGLMIYTRYDDPLAELLAIGLCVWLAVLYLSIPTKSPAVRAGVFLGQLAVGYYFIGASILVFAGTACLAEALVRRRPVVAVVQAALAGAALFVLGAFVFKLSPRAVYTVGTLWGSMHGRDFCSLSRVLTAILYALVPALMLIAIAANRVFGSPGRRQVSRRDKKSDRPRLAGSLRSIIATSVRLVMVVLVAGLCLGLSRNYIRDERMLHYYTSQRDWDGAMALAHHMHGRDGFTRSGVFDINRALAHEGRLGEELCAYPQDEAKTLFLSFDDMAGRLQHAKQLELYLDLGCVNAAEKNAYELLDNEGPSPHTLEALVRVHLVKGEYESARIAFEALRRYVGSGEYVRKWQDVIADPAKVESHPLLGAWRRVQGSIDYAVGGISFEPLLKRLLQETPDHRLALEYLMAQYLLKHQRAEFVSCLPLLRSTGCKQLPRQYTEAVLVYSLETRTSPETLGWAIEPDVSDRFHQMRSIVMNARGDNQAAFDALATKYGDTYAFYSLFNVCGLK